MSELVIFTVPELARRPMVGGGCCAVASIWLVQDAISQLPGIQEVRADDRRGYVSVSFDAEKSGIRQIAEELEGLGFPPTGIARIKQARCC